MSDPIQYPSIPTPLLAYLMDQAGQASEMSPRHLWHNAVAPNLRQAKELFDAEILAMPKSNAQLSPKFARIARTVLNPRTNLTFRAWGDSLSAVETNLQFPGFIRDGNGVALNQVDGAFRIGAFFDESDVLEQVASLIIDIPSSVKPVDFEAHLPISIATTLFAILDFHRGAEYPSAPYSSVAISGYIQGQWGLTGFDKLLSFIPALGHSSEPPTLTEVEFSLATLTNMAFLEEIEENYYDLGPELLPLVGLTRGEMPGLQWQRITKDNNGDLLTANRIWLYGNDGLILMLAPMTETSILMSSVKPDVMKKFFVNEMIGPIPTSQDKVTTSQEPLTKKIANQCVKCGVPMKVDVKFCTSCGTPAPLKNKEKISPTIETNQNHCTSCDYTLQPEVSFCTNCGRKV